MKTFFVITDNSPWHYALLKTSINSLKANTSLDPYCIYTGSIDHPILDWLKKKNIPILKHTLSFINSISGVQFEDFNLPPFYADIYRNNKHLHTNNLIVGGSIKVDIPLILQNHNIDDECILYSDIDTLFLGECELSAYKPTVVGAALRGHWINDGVMLFNVPGYAKEYPAFKQFYIENKFNFKPFWGTQGAFIEYFYGKIGPMPLTYNWHAFWEINPAAKIIHFCGLKPRDYKLIYEGNVKNYSQSFIDIANINKKQILHHIDLWEKYYEA